ncbi:MAG: hypothetical protein STSR0004_00560 [Peptococcaceae bacterium]
MEKQIRDELKILKDIIVDTVPVEQIFLFGSYANGTPHANSDLDIYVVMPEFENEEITYHDTREIFENSSVV